MGQGSRDAKTGLLELDDPSEGIGGTDGTDGTEAAQSGVAPAPSPTIIPAFNPEKYAEESEFRERMPTLTDDSLLEQARLQSLPSNVPPPRRAPVSTVPPPSRANPRDSSVEIDTGESDFDALGESEQVAILSAGLSPLTRVPTLAKELTELGHLLADPKTAYVLGFVDGILPLETIIDVTGLPELETLSVLDRMVGQGVVVFKRPR